MERGEPPSAAWPAAAPAAQPVSIEGVTRGGPAPELLPEAAPPQAVDPLAASVRAAVEAEAELLDGEGQEQLTDALVRCEEESGIPALLVAALIRQESRFDPRAVGPRGSLGLMQIRPFVARDVADRRGFPYEGRESLFEPEPNVTLGCVYLEELRVRFGSLTTALAAYNRGPTRVSRELRQGKTRGRSFIRKVLSHYEELHLRYGVAAPQALALPAAAAQ
jgi:soluble lytic murein transglycosylase-like protein